MHCRKKLVQAAVLVPALICATSQWSRSDDPAPTAAATSVGPDLIVSNILQPSSYAYVQTEGGLVTGYSVGAALCNVGDDVVLYQDFPMYHPMVRSSMFRLRADRFEQIGISWVYNAGFYATNDADCGLECLAPDNANGSALYPGCSGPHSGSVMGIRAYLGPASKVNSHLAVTSLPFQHPPETGQNGRLQVHNVDLDPALNPGAQYFVEVQTLAPDDAAAGNGNNNVTHQPIKIVTAISSDSDTCSGSDPNRFCISLTGSVHQEEPAIRAWKDQDPLVVETMAQVPGEGLFILAAKVSSLADGYWRYEYALQNVNSDRSAQAFSVPIPLGAITRNAGFHDVDYHSGEPYMGDDWDIISNANYVAWSTQPYFDNSNANALRWGTLYNFRFESNAPPAPVTVQLKLFKPGSPESIDIQTTGPWAQDPCHCDDFDCDCDMDLADFSAMLECFSGQGHDVSSDCRILDLDGDEIIDQLDVYYFSLQMSGPRN